MSRLIEAATFALKGHIKLYEQDRPENVLYEDHNIIVNTVKSLFARLMFANANQSGSQFGGAQFGVWGIAIGTGASNWPTDNQPQATVSQTSIITQVLRKPLSLVTFLDANGNPTLGSTDSNGNAIPGITDVVSFQTTLNSTTDGLTDIMIREMGLIGGGVPQVHSASGVALNTPTNMLTAPFWDPAAPNPDSVTLINYKTMTPLGLPAGINFILDWQLSF